MRDEESERLRRRLKRERAAREQAEQLLEGKARELYRSNAQLKKLLHELEDKVVSRTENLRVALDEAEGADRVKSEFLAMISHEIRTPMNAIHGMAQLLEESDLNDEQQMMAGLIINSSQALLLIVNDLLDLSKIEAGKLELERVTFSLEETVDGIIQIYTPRAEAKGLSLITQIDPVASLQYRGDPGRIRQVLMNLVDNAIKYSPQGEVRLAIEAVESGGESQLLRFSIRDQGPGIPESMRARLFQKFDRLGMTGNIGIEGTGLGLALCKQLVELMHGTIGVDSRPEEGATFWFTVSLRVIDEQPAPATEPASERSASRQLRILVAEDNLANQMVIQLMLRKLGHLVEVASNGNEVLQAIDLAPFDLVLMDMQMPEMDGLEATRRIRTLAGGSSGVPIVALTANAMEGDRHRCEEAGMDGFVSKPVTRDALVQALCDYARPEPVAVERLSR